MDDHDHDHGPGVLETDRVEIRTLGLADLDWMVRIDREYSGKARRAFYEVKLAETQRDTGLRISLAALVDGTPAGFLMGRVYYGEFGVPDPVAILDTIVVSRDFAHQHVGDALLRQLRLNLAALRIEKIQTQVEWEQAELMGFFRHVGFVPAPRLCLELKV